MPHINSEARATACVVLVWGAQFYVVDISPASMINQVIILDMAIRLAISQRLSQAYRIES